MNIIESVDLSYKENNEEIIKSVNLKVHTGDIYGLLDLYGFTKGVFVKLFSGKIKPSQGYLIIKGIDTNRKKKIKCLVSSSYKLPGSCKFFSGYACLVFYAMLYKAPKRRVDEVFELLGLLKVKNKRVSKYSLYMKKRLALARALLKKSEVIIIEQPTIFG
ncbi:MAG: putative ABC transporter ATP-binding protein YxlF [Firmicutes bacterium ADurb.Bin419]|nr:MAG: putative ABC transporter ATP-binding protein YxlF [Firmicutes bacterium ADurb.Bin419]